MGQTPNQESEAVLIMTLVILTRCSLELEQQDIGTETYSPPFKAKSFKVEIVVSMAVPSR
jgi:hypothetical protein